MFFLCHSVDSNRSQTCLYHCNPGISAVAAFAKLWFTLIKIFSTWELHIMFPQFGLWARKFIVGRCWHQDFNFRLHILILLLNILFLFSDFCLGWVGLWGFLWWAPSTKRKDHHGVSSGWSSVWHHSNTGLSSTQYEQIPIILGVWSFWLTPFLFSVNNILVGLWLNCISSVEIAFFLLADILLQRRALFQC